jgi:hypothetical protein
MTDIASKLRGFCHTRWHDGIDYSDYIEQLPPSKQNNICVYNRYFNIIHERLVHRYKEIGRMLGKMMSAPENWCGRFGK